jgi:RNA polymerase sigma factor (sigma-70 family)
MSVDLHSLSDEALMRQVCLEDSGAFEELVGRFQTRLFHFVLRRLRDRQAAEDVVQETLLKVWKHKQSFQHGSRLSTWIFALSLNLCRDHWRRLKPESSLERLEVAMAAESSSLRQRGPSAEDVAATHELSERLLQALETLPPAAADLLKRRSQDDVSLEEAGEKAGLSPNAARAAASRAYKKLRQLLDGKRD